MAQILFKLGPFAIQPYGFFLTVAFLTAFVWLALEAGLRRLQFSVVIDLALVSLAGFLIGARSHYVLRHFAEFSENPWLIPQFWKGGLIFLGGFTLLALAWMVTIKLKNAPVWPWADGLAPALAVGECIGRFGLFINDNGPLALSPFLSLPWKNPTHPLFLFPEDILGLLACIVSFLALLWARSRLSRPGQLMGLYFIMIGLIRIGFEWNLHDLVEGIGNHPAEHYFGPIFLTAGTYLFFRRTPCSD